jgi:hypothetical protein
MINNSSRISQTSHGVGESLIGGSAIFTPRYVRCKEKKTEKNPNNTQTSFNSEKLRLGLVLNSKEFREL